MRPGQPYPATRTSNLISAAVRAHGAGKKPICGTVLTTLARTGWVR
jgi:hypothetical protein